MKIYVSFRHHWLKLRPIGIQCAVEGAGTAISAITGLLIVQGLSKGAYGEYVFLINFQILLSGLSDLGTTKCFLPLVGARQADRDYVCKVGFVVRRSRVFLLAIAALLLVPYWLVSSRHNGWLQPGFICATIALLGLAYVSIQISQIRAVLRLIGTIPQLNRMNFVDNIARLAFVGCALLLIPSSQKMMLVCTSTFAAGGFTYGLFRRLPEVRAWFAQHLPKTERSAIRTHLLRLQRPLWFFEAFFFVQGPLVVFLVAWVSNASTLAEVGALSRLTALLSIAERVMGMLFLPRLASMTSPQEICFSVMRLLGLYWGCLLILQILACMWPGAWLLILGAKYAGLYNILWIAILYGLLMNASALAQEILHARGYNQYLFVLVPLVVITQVVYVAEVGLGTTTKAVYFNLLQAVVYVLFNYARLAGYLWRMHLRMATGKSVKT